MRIGMMVDSYKPYISGITNYVEVNKRRLEVLGHEVFVFTFGDDKTADKDPRVIRTPGLALSDTGYFLSMRYSRYAKNLLQTMDIVHVHHPFLSGRLALRYCKPLNIPIVFTNHSRYDLYAQTYLSVIPDEMSVGMLRAYLPGFCNSVDLVIAPSKGMENVLRELKVECPIVVIPNGVDINNFIAAKPLNRKDFNFREDDILLIYAGRIAMEKNLPFLLESFAGLAQTIPNAYLLLVGGGVKQHVEEIHELTRELQLNNRVRFIGKVEYTQVASYLAMCDIFVTASTTEVHPLSIIEAMCAGLPIMGIQSVGLSDIVQDMETGFLSKQNQAAFTAKLTRLCLESNLRKRLGKAAQNAAKIYNVETTSEIMLGHYQNLAHTSKPHKSSWRTRFRVFAEKFIS